MGVEEYIPDRIAGLSEKRGYTKYRLSQITGMTQTALGNILSQKSIPTIPTLERICDAFNYIGTIFLRGWESVGFDG